MQSLDNTKIAINGLGYVGLPLAVEFGKHYDTVGFAINALRVDELRGGVDYTLEVDAGIVAVGHQQFVALGAKVFAPAASRHPYSTT